MRNYLGLHKHAAVRVELLSRPAVALRLAVAHMIAGSRLWSVKPEPQRADSEAIAASLAKAEAVPRFAEERAAVAALLNVGEDEGDIVRHGCDGHRDLGMLFGTLLGMADETVLRVLAFVMAETLEAHAPVIEQLGGLFGTDMRNWWSPDQTFFDLVRDKRTVNGMLREVAGDITADAHLASTAKVQKIIADCISGEGRAKVESWLPRWMTFAADSDAMPTPDLNGEDDAAAVTDDSHIADAA